MERRINFVEAGMWLKGNQWARWAIGGLAVGAVAASLHIGEAGAVELVATVLTGAACGLVAMAVWRWLVGYRSRA
jgi:hypothetical protein